MSISGVASSAIFDPYGVFTSTTSVTNTVSTYDSQIALLRGQISRTQNTYEEALVNILRVIESGRVDAARQACTESIARLVAQKFA